MPFPSPPPVDPAVGFFLFGRTRNLPAPASGKHTSFPGEFDGQRAERGQHRHVAQPVVQRWGTERLQTLSPGPFRSSAQLYEAIEKAYSFISTLGPMFIDYAIFGVISLATLIYAYVNRPDGDSDGGDDGGSRHLPTSPSGDAPDQIHDRPDRPPISERPLRPTRESAPVS